MNVPDVVGFTIEDARKMLKTAGFSVHAVRVTAPPRHRTLEYDDNCRVIRLHIIDGDRTELLVCGPGTV